MSGIFSLFNIFSLLYIFRSVQLGLIIRREWTSIIQEPLTPRKKSLANQASFFIAVPIAVFIHELGHALAVWLSGGEVVEFHYRVFWGYVRPAGQFSAVETWIIAIAGTVGSLAFGLAIWLIFRQSRISSLRYFGLRAFRFQIYFSLLYYPIFTLLGFDGDWKTIYSFASTPWLSGFTAILHAGILVVFWQIDRQGWFEAPSFNSEAEQREFGKSLKASTLVPGDPQLQIQYIDALRRGGAKQKANYLLQDFLKNYPDSPIAYMELAILQSSGKQQVPKKAVVNAQKALQLGLQEPQQSAYAHELIGRYHLDRDQTEQAINSFSEAIALVKPNRRDEQNMPANIDFLIQLHLLRSQAYRRKKNFDQAYQEIIEARKIAQMIGNKVAEGQIEKEIETLEKHAGQNFDSIPTKTNN